MSTRLRRILPLLLAAVLVVAGLWALRGIGPSTLPTPGSAGSGWNLKVQFPDVLNLPERAKVRMRGRDVGSLDGVRLQENRAEAVLRIESSTQVPRSTIVELRQDTPLGDIYVALTPPETGTGAAMFRDGDTVPQAQTRAPVQMEQLLTSLADFLGSGSLSQLGNTFHRLNSAFPEDPAVTRKIVGNLTTTVRSLSNDTTSLNTALVSLVELTDRLVAEREQLGRYLDPARTGRWDVIVRSGDVISVFAGLAPVFANATFLVPTLRETNTLLRSVVRPLLYYDRPAGSTRPDNVVNLRNLLRDTVIPYLHEGAKVNVVRLGMGSEMPSGEQADQAVRTLRMLGVVR